MELTERQRQILSFIANYKVRHGVPPTMREIAQHLQIYLRGVQYHLERLERAGYLTRARKRSRAIDLRQEQRAALTPLLGRVAAGKPVLAEEHIEASYPLPQAWTGSGETFLLKVQGDSMRDAYIVDGDLVLVKVQPDARSGEIVVAMVEDEVTVKRFQMDGTTVVLKPENEQVAPIVVREGRASGSWARSSGSFGSCNHGTAASAQAALFAIHPFSRPVEGAGRPRPALWQ